MKKSLITMMAALMGTAFAGEATTDNYQVSAPQDFQRLSGALHVGAGTAYTLHGYVVSRAVIQGAGYGMGAIQYNYDFGKEGAWSYAGALSYKAPMSGHTLYGNPTMSRDQFVAAAGGQVPPTMNGDWSYLNDQPHPEMAGVSVGQAAEGAYQKKKRMGGKNVENEFVLRNSLKYTSQYWNVAFGHDYIHGGIPGVVSKHYDLNDHSYMQQGFVNFEVTPVAWFSADINCARTFDTMDGWWFEAHARLKAPIVGSPENIKVAGILEYGMSWTANFYNSEHNACSNGTQAFWLKLSTPWFVNEAKNFILTPSVSFNWLGKGGMKANERSHAKVFGDQYKPFRDFAVVGDLTATYKF